MQTLDLIGAAELRPENTFNHEPEGEPFVLDLCAAAEPEPLLYDRKTVAKLLSVSIRSVDYMIASGKLKHRRIGSRVLVPAEAVRKLAEQGCSYGVV